MEILQTETLDTSWFDEYDKLLIYKTIFKKKNYKV